MKIEEINYNANHVNHNKPMTCVRYIIGDNVAGMVMFEYDELHLDDGLSEYEIKQLVFEKIREDISKDEDFDSDRYIQKTLDEISASLEESKKQREEWQAESKEIQKEAKNIREKLQHLFSKKELHNKSKH